MTDWETIVVDLLNEEDVDRAMNAVDALNRAADESRLPRLYELLAYEGNFFVREAAAVPIARLEGLRALPQLLHALRLGVKEGHDNDSLCSVLMDLVSDHADEAEPTLALLIVSDSEQDRADAAWLWACAHKTIDPDPLVNAMRDPAANVRLNAADSLGSFKTCESAFGALIQTLDDPAPGVRASAASALGYYGDPRATGHLQELASDASEEVRRMAKLAIEKLTTKVSWMTSISRWLLVLLFVACAATDSTAAEPTIRSLDLRGLRVGGVTTITIEGDDLGASPRLLLPIAAQQTLKPGGSDRKAAFDVTLPADAIPGYYHLRVVNDNGVSLPAVVTVDALPQSPFAGTVAVLPMSLHGTVAGSATVETKFQGKAKQRIQIEVEAQRLGSKLRPILHLYNARKLEIAWAWGMPMLFGDARIEATLPEDGAYTVALHDVEYAAGTPGFFRLKIGEWSYVDQIFPPVIGAGKSEALDLIGMLTPARLEVTAPKLAGALPLAWPKGSLWSGPRPFVRVSTRAEFVEKGTQEFPAGPLGVSGRLLTPNEEDEYRVAVVPGKKVRLEVFAERLGSPIDVALVVRNEKGVQLARAEDSPGSLDPVLEYAVPDKVTAITVGVIDAAGRGGPRGIYRLTVDPSTTGDGFKLTTPAHRAGLAAGGRSVVPVFVERRGYPGRIELSANLPKGVKLQGESIPEGADGTLVMLERGDAMFDATITTWRGRGADNTEASVILKGHPLERLQPWLATEIAVAPTNFKTSDFAVDWRELPATAGLVPGAKLALPIKAPRTVPKTTVKLTLLTSQQTPLVNNQPDPNKALRQEKPVELAATATDGEIVVLAPADLPAPSYDVTVQAELLDAAKKVLATAYAPVRRLNVDLPIVVKLNGDGRVETSLDAKKGAVLKIAGKIERRPGVKADVAVTVTGLPGGVKAETVTVKADASTFALNVVLPPTLAPGEFKGIKVAGSIAPEPKTPNVRVRSREVDVTLVIQAAKK